MIPSATILRKLPFLLTLLLFVGCLIPANAQGSITLGAGKLSYNVSSGQSTCGGGSGPAYAYWWWTYNSFQYTLAGTTYALNGSTTVVYGYHPSMQCPPNLLDEPISLALPASIGPNCSIYFDPSYNPNSGQLNATASMPCQDVSGGLDPKYAVLGVYYAPPGSGSSVAYTNSSTIGTSSSVDKSFSNAKALSVSVGVGVKILGNSIDLTGTTSGGYTQQADSSSSIALLSSVSDTETLFGPTVDGLDHSSDVVWIWLNPVVNLDFLPPVLQTNGVSISETGYSFDSNDPCLCMDVVPLTVKELLNPSLITNPSTLQSLRRAWAPNTSNGMYPGLNSADFAAIAQSDPYSNPSYHPTTQTYSDGSTCTTDGRYCMAKRENVAYTPFITSNLTLTSSTTSTQATATTDTKTLGFSFEANAKSGFLAKVKLDIKTSDTFTWVNKHTSQSSGATASTASATIAGPSDFVYTGPTEFCIYTDSIYGTFMFLACN